MRTFFKLKNSLSSFVRSKSEFSSTKKDKQIIKRLDNESNLLFGEPLKNGRRKARQNMKYCLEDDSVDECIYYESYESEKKFSVDNLSGNCNSSENSFQPFDKVVPGEGADVKEYDENDKSKIIVEPVRSFPLFNEMKPEYVSTHIYFINSAKKKLHETFPTVTTVINETMSEKSKIFLNRWKENQISELGADQFHEQQKKQLQSRNVLLKLIQRRLLGVRKEDLNVLPELEGCWQSLECVFPLFSQVQTMQKIAVHPHLQYKGMIDSIVEFKNKPVLACWKRSSKLKSSINMTFDTPIQIAAYIGALNYDDNYPFKVEESLLVMSYDDGSKADIFHLKKENCIHYWEKWLQRLHLFQFKFDDLRSKQLEVKKTDDFQSDGITSKLSTKGFDSTAYRSSTEGKTNSKRDKKLEEFQVDFPLYNDRKEEYICGHSYEINPVKQTVFDCYSSVTAILGETKSESAKFVLNRWKENLIAQLGVEGFENYHRNLLESGTLLHKLIQQRLLGVSEKDLDIVPELAGCWKSLQDVFPLFSDIKITESNVVHRELKYKGIIDCIVEFRGKPLVVDWKKSDKVKTSIDMTYDAPLQIAAYVGATNYDDFYPFKIKEGLLIISYTDGTKADIFHLNKDSCLRYWSSWLQRLYKYRRMLKADDLKIDY